MNTNLFSKISLRKTKRKSVTSKPANKSKKAVISHTKVKDGSILLAVLALLNEVVHMDAIAI